MSKNITIKVTKLSINLGPFDIYTNSEKVATNISRNELIQGKTLVIENENVNTITIKSIGKCLIKKTFPLKNIDIVEYANVKFQETKTSSIWTHLKNSNIYNSFYGITSPYILEYPFAYQFQDEILQNVIDYTKVYKYLNDFTNEFNTVNKIQTDNEWFNKSIVYNEQQSTGILKLLPKPINSLKSYMSYPIYNEDSKTILYTKSDNFYQYNTFWSIVKDKNIPLFKKTCENMSIDKEVNQENMDYSKRSFKKEPIRAKDLKIRHILDNKTNINIVSQFIVTPTQISHK